MARRRFIRSATAVVLIRTRRITFEGPPNRALLRRAEWGLVGEPVLAERVRSAARRRPLCPLPAAPSVSERGGYRFRQAPPYFPRTRRGVGESVAAGVA